MTESVAVLGSTGSIGVQTLDICRKLNIRVDALSAGGNTDILEKQIREFRPSFCGVADEKRGRELSVSVSDTGTKVIYGERAAREIASLSSADTVVNAISGVAGLVPTLSVIRSGKRRIALANKESLVTCGELVMKEAKRRDVEIIPVDSEHSAIFQCVDGREKYLDRLIITASGGPFFGKTREETAFVTPESALSHPTWRMGRRITIDSATMMNKGFEVIEAAWLFSVPVNRIDVTVHRQSVVHSMASFIDGAVIAQLGVPDMRTCISYALSYPARSDFGGERLDINKIGCLTFTEPDGKNFPLLPLARRAFEAGGTLPASMNAADEVAVDLFLKGRIGFNSISDLVSEVTGSAGNNKITSERDVIEADLAAREAALSLSSRKEYRPVK